MGRKRLLLVDDDASIRRFVALALEGLDVDLLPCGSVEEALQTLRARGTVDLLMTDLMMPGESGLVLLRHLADQPALRGQARLVVFSAGLGAPVQAQLASFDIWRQLAKPVSALALEACVQEALEAGPAAAAAVPPAAAHRAASAGHPPVDAITAHFGGDHDLYHAFREGCLDQFRADIARGEVDVALRDFDDLRHLAHSLKSVLTLIGEPDASHAARHLENAAARPDAGEAARWWEDLRHALASLVEENMTKARPN